jgi:type II secretory pathway component PulC
MLQIMRFIWHKKSVLGMSLLLAILVYWAQGKWHFLSYKADSNPPVMANLRQNPQSSHLNNGIAANPGMKEILSANLLGMEITNPPVVSDAQQEGLELHGIIFSLAHPEQAVALIAARGKLAEAYQVGEHLAAPEEGTVLLILPGSVQIKRGGGIESLETVPHIEN